MVLFLKQLQLRLHSGHIDIFTHSIQDEIEPFWYYQNDSLSITKKNHLNIFLWPLFFHFSDINWILEFDVGNQWGRDRTFNHPYHFPIENLLFENTGNGATRKWFRVTFEFIEVFSLTFQCFFNAYFSFDISQIWYGSSVSVLKPGASVTLNGILKD